MAYRGSPSNDDLTRVESRERGSRRRKFAGYLKAANELRQTYTQGWSRGEPETGPFADVGAVSNGNEEMILFPSYAKHHIKVKPEAVPGTIQSETGTGRDLRDTTGIGDAEFWRQQWDAYENDHAIVDVDVRGWLFVPQQGNLTRRQRLMVALARQLVGIAAPGGTGRNSASSSVSNSPVRAVFPTEEELVASREADEIVRKGEVEARIANGGGFSELEGRNNALSRTSSMNSLHMQYSGNDAQSVRRSELDFANHNLMARLRPFMANPLANVTVNAFFYNEHMSRQRTFMTDAAGHFTFRAALDFVPTHVRVLSTEKLSMESEITIIDKAGISLVSDIDDTVKHAGITKGAREIFRNAFTKELDELTVPGIRECYKALEEMGVQFHYVSNSPWQLYPVLTSYFSLAGLPLGTFHLKQYSGMLQGIFEPVAERKKSSMDRILRDFPDRRFFLVGDSGEADLEVYTDVVLENPGRIIGVFIRDVTTPSNKFFSSSASAPYERGMTSSSMGSDGTDQLQTSKRFPSPDVNSDAGKEGMPSIMRSANDGRPLGKAVEQLRPSRGRPPVLPPRSVATTSAADIDGDLIDLTDDDNMARLSLSATPKPGGVTRPKTPAKPERLRSSPPAKHTATLDDRLQAAVHGDQDRGPPALPARRPATSDEKSGTEPPPPSSLMHAATFQGSSDGGHIKPPVAPPLRKKRSSYQIVTDRLSGNWSGSEPDEAVVDKKEEVWKRRLERARQILASKGVILRTWRGGDDIKAECIAAVKEELRKLEGQAKPRPPAVPRKAVWRQASSG